MHLRVQEVSNFLAVGGLGSGVSQTDPLRVEVHLRAEASISRFLLLQGVVALRCCPEVNPMRCNKS